MRSDTLLALGLWWYHVNSKKFHRPFLSSFSHFRLDIVSSGSKNREDFSFAWLISHISWRTIFARNPMNRFHEISPNLTNPDIYLHKSIKNRSMDCNHLQKCQLWIGDLPTGSYHRYPQEMDILGLLWQ